MAIRSALGLVTMVLCLLAAGYMEGQEFKLKEQIEVEK
jgi:hypothetical protein